MNLFDTPKPFEIYESQHFEKKNVQEETREQPKIIVKKINLNNPDSPERERILSGLRKKLKI